MARPTNEEKIQKGLEKTFEALRNQIPHSSAARLTAREMVFARLVGEENETYTDAYKVAFEPSPDAKEESIHQMASRVAKRPRVMHEIERIKREISEDSLRQEKKLAIALDGETVRNRMAIELFAIATSDVDHKTKLKAWDMLGSMRHVNAFVTGNTIDLPRAAVTTLGVKADQDAAEAKRAVMGSIAKLIGARAPQRTIDLTPVSKEKENVGQ